MPSSDAFALRRSGLNEFLFAVVGTEANGMTLSLVSVFARLGEDPWREAGRLAALPKSDAIESLAPTIAGMPTSVWPLPAATAIAARLIPLLPTQSGQHEHMVQRGRLLKIGLMLVSVACAAALAGGVFTTMNAPKPDGSDVADFAVPPR